MTAAKAAAQGLCASLPRLSRRFGGRAAQGSPGAPRERGSVDAAAGTAMPQAAEAKTGVTVTLRPSQGAPCSCKYSPELRVSLPKQRPW